MAFTKIAAGESDLDLLIAKIAEDDKEALAQLYQETRSGVYSYALSILKDRHDAEDVLQDCYICIRTAAKSYEPCGKPMAWILTITKHLCLKILEQKKYSASLTYDQAAPSTDPDDKLVIEACLRILGDTERQIVVLHAVSGIKHREIAQVMELPLATVLSKYHRALKKMKKHLEKEN